MKHLAPIRMFGPGKGDFKSEDPRGRDFRAEVEKLDSDTDTDDDDPGATKDETVVPEGSSDDDADGTEGTNGSKPAVPKD